MRHNCPEAGDVSLKDIPRPSSHANSQCHIIIDSPAVMALCWTTFLGTTGAFASHAPPVFLAPLLASKARTAQISQFSTSTPLCQRRANGKHKRDSNPDRGVSALRRTGLRHPVSMSKVPLPQPVLDPERRKFDVAESHGLWGFFNAKRSVLSTPEEDAAHGAMGSIAKM